VQASTVNLLISLLFAQDLTTKSHTLMQREIDMKQFSINSSLFKGSTNGENFLDSRLLILSQQVS